jgi:cell division protein FtsB
MRLFRLFISFYIGLIFSFVSAFFFGEAGLGEYSSLLEYRETLERNLADLKALNQRLNQEFKNLGTEPEKIRLLARDLGYFGSNENVVRIQNLPQKRRYYEVGKLLKRDFRWNKNMLFIRIMNLLLPVLFYIISGFIWRAFHRGH